MTDNERPISGGDEEHLAKVIVDSLREVERYFEDGVVPVEEAFRALHRADLATQELGDRLWRLRGKLNALVAPATTELNSAVLRPHLVNPGGDY